MTQNSVIIGLTGQTGSGKSSVAEILADNGAYVIDADKIAHGVLLPDGGAYDEVVANLGESILDKDKNIDRKKVAAIVFNDPEALKIHTAATHKHILFKINDEIAEAIVRGEKTIVIDAPLLIEAGLHKKCGFVWAVCADYKTRLNRIITRDKLSGDDAIRRMSSQTQFDEIRKHANTVIINDSDRESLSREVLKRLGECVEK